MDNKQKTGSPDKDKINVKESYELEYWSKKFKVTPDQLKQAVKSAGTSAIEVEKLLKKLK
ncbi:DUF3606 domain-containing protein [Pedobacter cryoconitis]|uniref:Uncharacterized protein DUF3606 n=1 Tax=Pedobacter cryoconitis TaxID=188932 RepID=A0A327S750_9SPHI|nr:DUF3606 domain-containing protein [Pedobacter cryoconitis]RAJ24618.1 uncharacterized protein DUF3606 [Pedobacter cryoconitis]